MKLDKKGLLVVISGPSGVGKGTVRKALFSRSGHDLVYSISMTTRKPRNGEIDGVDYYFISREEFEKKIENNEFLEYAKVRYGEYFGTPKKEIEDILEAGKNVILEIDVQGAKQVKEMFPETILIFILAPSFEEVKRRIKARGLENNEQIIDRFKTAYKEINEIPKYNYVVVNDDVDKAVLKVESILVAQKCRVDRIEEIAVENQEEILHEFIMDKEFDNTPINYNKDTN